MTFDKILRGGLIFDGSGSPPYQADIAIHQQKVVKISPRVSETAIETIDAKSMWICPGFIDIHTHYDAEIEIQPALSESVRHGVTSVVMGNCSLSLNLGSPAINADLFERVETMPELIALWKQQAQPWQTTTDYLQHLSRLNLGPNVATLAGHSALRAHVMGLERSLTALATDDEIKAMVKLANEALDAGCIGISIDMVHWHRTTGLYTGSSLPSHHAGFKEYAALASVCRARDAVFQVTPNPKNLWPSILTIVRLSYGIVRAPLRCTVLSAMDLKINPQAWRAFPLFTFICNQFLGCNIRFQTIPEPFTIYSDGPITPLFEEFNTGVLLNNCKTREQRQQLWQSPQFKQQFKTEWRNLKNRTFDGDLSHTIIVKASRPEWIGLSVENIARTSNEAPLAFFIDLLEAEDTAFRWKHTGANHREVIRHRLLKHPYILPGFSDAGAHCRNMAYFDSALSLIKQSVQTAFMPVEQAIKRVTAEPAQWFNVKCGRITLDAQADLVLLDPKRLQCPIVSPIEHVDPDLQDAMRMVKRDTHSPVNLVMIAGEIVVKHGVPLPILGEAKLGGLLRSTVPVVGHQKIYERYRNRVNDEIWDHPFEDYWDVFVLKHQKVANILLHCVAFVIMYALLGLFIMTQSVWVLLAMPLSQITGLIGHYYFERSNIDQRDTAFSWRALWCLHKLFYYVFTGRYSKECHRVTQQLSYFQAGK